MIKLNLHYIKISQYTRKKTLASRLSTISLLITNYLHANIIITLTYFFSINMLILKLSL
jgi:exopolysaccharide biosynthesis predicted pyruvyltransferase EpsI